MRVIDKFVEVNYGTRNDLVKYLCDRIPTNYPELLERSLKKISFKRRGKRRLKVVALQPAEMDGVARKDYPKVMEILRRRKLKPAGVWELASLLPVDSVYRYPSIREGIRAHEAFKAEFGENIFLVGFGHHIGGWMGPQYATIQRIERCSPQLSFCFTFLFVSSRTYYVGYEEVR